MLASPAFVAPETKLPCSSQRLGKSAPGSRRRLDSSAALRLHCRVSEPPRITPKKSLERAAREARLAKALRENLLRRKEQKRAQARRAVVQSQETDPEREPPA
jgi:hypothetical protein